MKIVPKPSKITPADGVTEFSASSRIECALPVVAKELLYLDFIDGKENAVVFEIDETVKEDYVLTVNGNICAKSATDEGLFHAAMTLKQLIFDGYKDGISQIPNGTVADSPRFGYRGFMLDIVRHFFPKEVILSVIDSLALVKINKFRLHLSDNQGYRLESKVFPVLNEKGNMRKGTRGDGVPVGGYLSLEDVKEIVSYAAERYIDVIPEIDLPGHTVAILAAMPEAGCTGEQFEVAERFGIDSRILCAGREENYAMLEKLLAEVTEMFPSEYFHLGGDEVPKTVWENCEKCQAVVKREGLKNSEELQGYFTNRVVRMLEKLGKKPIAWNEAMYSGMLDGSVTCQYWSDGKRAERVVAEADKGRKIIVSKCRPYYMDYPHGLNKLKAVYRFNPSELFDEKGEKNILGVECPLWTEFVADADKLFRQAFPRTFAVAEAGWSGSEKNYADFVERLYVVLGIMQAYDRPYTELKDADPNPLVGGVRVAKFFLNMIDVDAIKSVVNAKNAQKGRKVQ